MVCDLLPSTNQSLGVQKPLDVGTPPSRSSSLPLASRTNTNGNSRRTKTFGNIPPLQGIVTYEPFCFAIGGFADIWRGVLNGKQVCTDPAITTDPN